MRIEARSGAARMAFWKNRRSAGSPLRSAIHKRARAARKPDPAAVPKPGRRPRIAMRNACLQTHSGPTARFLTRIWSWYSHVLRVNRLVAHAKRYQRHTARPQHPRQFTAGPGNIRASEVADGANRRDSPETAVRDASRAISAGRSMPHVSAQRRVHDAEVNLAALCGAGFQPAAGLQPAWTAWANARWRPIRNRPQVKNLPHNSAAELAHTSARIRAVLRANRLRTHFHAAHPTAPRPRPRPHPSSPAVFK